MLFLNYAVRNAKMISAYVTMLIFLVGKHSSRRQLQAAELTSSIPAAYMYLNTFNPGKE